MTPESPSQESLSSTVSSSEFDLLTPTSVETPREWFPSSKTETITSAAGSFYTTAATETFPKPFANQPEIIYGINYIDASNGHNIRVRSSIKGLGTSSFKIHVGSWEDSYLYKGGASWLGLSPEKFKYQSGQFSTSTVYHWTRPKQRAARRIEFDQPFEAPPKVVCFFQMLDMDRHRNWRARVEPQQIDKTGFTIVINTWADTILYGATAGWVAHAKDDANFASGTADSGDVFGYWDPQMNACKKVSFEGGLKFDKKPNVFMALSSIDMSKNHWLRIDAKAENITERGLTWCIQTWHDSILYSARASYLCVA